MLTRNTANRLIPFSSEMMKSRAFKSYTNSTLDLWDQNVENGKFIIAYQINEGMDDLNRELIPKVND